ncbi:MAG TPA: hypothetical protein VKD72_29090 [Gemmataceae bacterium]|nr:hypothetical protein [Gemmataceae bacterium]
MATIFLDVHLPNAPTWFYLSLLLAVALFFKFSRVLSVRNWDVLTLFLLVPGLLMLAEARPHLADPANPLRSAWLRYQWFGFFWLFCGSGYFILRCLLDLTLVRRPALSPNLSSGGLAWLALALFVCLAAVAFRPTAEPEPVGKVSEVLDQAEKGAKGILEHQTALNGSAEIDWDYWFGRAVAVLCHLSIVGGLVYIGWRHFQDLHIGIAAATFYLLLPYTAYHAGQWHHVWPMALAVWAVALYRRPTLAGLLLGLAAGTVYFPLLMFPVWCGFYGRRGAGRFSGAFILAGGLCLAVIGFIKWQAGELPRSMEQALSLADWAPWILPKEDTQGFWTGVDWAWAYRIPVFILYLALLITTAFWPSPKNLAHLLALSTALLIGIQFWYAEQGGVYVSWYLPLLLLMVFRPNLNDRRPLPIPRETDWLLRLGRWLRRLALRLLRIVFPQGNKVTP